MPNANNCSNSFSSNNSNKPQSYWKNVKPNVLYIGLIYMILMGNKFNINTVGVLKIGHRENLVIQGQVQIH